MLATYEHHALRMDDLRREAAHERTTREALAARKEAGRHYDRFRPWFPLRGKRRGGEGPETAEEWVRAA